MLSNTPIISALHHVLTLVAVLCSLQEQSRAEENLRLLDLTCSPSGNICWNAAFFVLFCFTLFQFLQCRTLKPEREAAVTLETGFNT